MIEAATEDVLHSAGAAVGYDIINRPVTALKAFPCRSILLRAGQRLLPPGQTVNAVHHNMITAGSTGALLWAKQILEHLGVFESNTLEAWYEYFRTGAPEHFFALMQSLPSRNES